MAGFGFRYQAPTGQFTAAAQAEARAIATAATGAIRDAGDFIKAKARANIASAGFSVRWQNAFRVNFYPDNGVVSIDPALVAYHKIPYAGVFEMGATITGSPLLWLPLPNVPTSVKGRHMSPANYIRLVGPLHTVIRPGKPPLLAAYMAGTGRITIAKLVAGAHPMRGQRTISVPLFFGINQVTLKKQFDIQPIFDQAVAGLGAGYLRNLKWP